MGYRREIVRAACIAALWIGSTAAANAAFFGFGERSAPGAHRQPRQGLVLAQVADPRVLALEEQVRSLSGQVEELNFLLLQLQEQMRKMQEDNEYRFQQLEGGGATTQQRSEAVPSPATPNPAAPDPAAPDPAAPNGNRVAGAAPAPGQGEPPRNLGAIVLNPDGSVKDVTLGEPMDLREAGPGAPLPPDDTNVAALPETSDPEQLYANSYEFILSGDYATAEAGFRRHVELFPNDPRTADARYWLGEALLSQDRHAEAAEVFLQASKAFPDARKAPDMLLKLGVALAAMGQKEVSCATFRQVETRYAGASSALIERVRQESALAGC